MDLGLSGKRALVGGGSAGLGAGIATVLAAEGARVAIVGRTKERLDAAAAATGAVPIVADLGLAEGPPSAVTSAVDELGGLDLLVVNSGGPPPGTFEQLDEAAWARAIEGTLLSTVRLHPGGAPAPARGEGPVHRHRALVIGQGAGRRAAPPATRCARGWRVW